MAETPTTYWDYIRVEDLLGLQSGNETEDGGLSADEVMFIIVHQVDELWMKLALRELVEVRNLFAQERVPEQALASAVSGIRRIALLARKMADQFEVMETMSPRGFLAFRDKLYPASGFQSAQLREIEVLMGLHDGERIPLGHEKSWLAALKYQDGRPSPAYDRVKARLEDRPTLLEAMSQWLHRTPIEGSTPDQPTDGEVVGRFIDRYCEAQGGELRRLQAFARQFALTDADQARLTERYDKEIASTRAFLLAEDEAEERRSFTSRVRAALVFIESYRELPLLAWPRQVLDAAVEMEQAMVVFRQRHARMVERMIGRRTGTGGSAGVDYLDRTASYRVFRDLWAIRTILTRSEALPELDNPGAYSLGVGQ